MANNFASAKPRRGSEFGEIYRTLTEGRGIRRMAWPPRAAVRLDGEMLMIVIDGKPRQRWYPHPGDILDKGTPVCDWEVVE